MLVEMSNKAIVLKTLRKFCELIKQQLIMLLQNPRICYNKLLQTQKGTVFACFLCPVSLAHCHTGSTRRLLVCGKHPLQVPILPQTLLCRAVIGNTVMRRRNSILGLTEFIVSIFIAVLVFKPLSLAQGHRPET